MACSIMKHREMISKMNCKRIKWNKRSSYRREKVNRRQRHAVLSVWYVDWDVGWVCIWTACVGNGCYIAMYSFRTLLTPKLYIQWSIFLRVSSIYFMFCNHHKHLLANIPCKRHSVDEIIRVPAHIRDRWIRVHGSDVMADLFSHYTWLECCAANIGYQYNAHSPHRRTPLPLMDILIWIGRDLISLPWAHK